MKSPIKSINFGFVKKTLAVGVFCLLFLLPNAFAKTLAEYRAGLESAKNSTEE